jgi:cytochrome c556
MTRLALSTLSALTLVFLAGCAGPVEDTLPGQPIKQRQEAFKEILRSFEPMGTMLRTQRYEADAFAEHAARLQAQADAPWRHFVDGSAVPPSKAKPAVWQRGEAFEQERARFLEAVEALALAAATRDEAAVRPAYTRVEQSCRSCHDDFRK